MTPSPLHLCAVASDLPRRLPFLAAVPILTSEDLAQLRRSVRSAAVLAGMDEVLLLDLATAATEAATNALVHGGGGKVMIGADLYGGRLQIWIIDAGPGIDLSRLKTRQEDMTADHGRGFELMIGLTDQVHVLTGPCGTTILLEASWRDDHADPAHFPAD